MGFLLFDFSNAGLTGGNHKLVITKITTSWW